MWIHSDPNADDGYWRDNGQRECARGGRCADPRLETVDGQTVRLGALSPRPLCDTCAEIVRRAIQELPSLWARVHGELGNRSQASGPKVSRSRTPPVLINLNADELLREVSFVLSSWHERVAAVARLASGWPHPAEHATLQAVCQVLTAHVGALLALPEEPMLRAVSLREAADLPPGTLGLVHIGAGYADVIRPLSGADAALEILHLHYRCRRLLAETNPPARHLPAPCRCGYRQLYETVDGDGQWDGARCRHCRAEYSLDDYRDLVAETGEMVRKAGVRRRRAAAGVFDDDGSRCGLGYEPFHHEPEETGAQTVATIP